MQTKEQIQDTIEVLSQIDARNIGEEAMEEVTYRVNGSSAELICKRILKLSKERVLISINFLLF